MTPKVPTTEAKINTWDYFKLKNFCTSKYAVNRLKRQLT